MDFLKNLYQNSGLDYQVDKASKYYDENFNKQKKEEKAQETAAKKTKQVNKSFGQTVINAIGNPKETANNYFGQYQHPKPKYTPTKEDLDQIGSPQEPFNSVVSIYNNVKKGAGAIAKPVKEVGNAVNAAVEAPGRMLGSMFPGESEQPPVKQKPVKSEYEQLRDLLNTVKVSDNFPGSGMKMPSLTKEYYNDGSWAYKLDDPPEVKKFNSINNQLINRSPVENATKAAAALFTAPQQIAAAALNKDPNKTFVEKYGEIMESGEGTSALLKELEKRHPKLSNMLDMPLISGLNQQGGLSEETV